MENLREHTAGHDGHLKVSPGNAELQLGTGKEKCLKKDGIRAAMSRTWIA